LSITHVACIHKNEGWAQKNYTFKMIQKTDTPYLEIHTHTNR
jgi:hypothetical protein